MSEQLVMCSCCGKMVPASNIELTYRKPDDIASMAEDEIEAKCKYTADYFVCEDEYFYIRCVLPLPVREAGRDYCIGVWVQVSPKSFHRIWDLWDDPGQSSEPPMRGLLANAVDLNTGAKNAEVRVHLKGPTSRPVAFLVDEQCSLYQEQQCGITIHRANEYSDLCR